MQSRKLKRFLWKHLQGSNKCLAFLSLLLVSIILYNKSRERIASKGIKFVEDAEKSETNVQDGFCGVNCGYREKSFYLKTGLDNSLGPTICYDGKIIISPETKPGDRGINLLVIDGVTLKIIDSKVFDTYVDDASFLQYMKDVPYGVVIIIVTFDEITERLSKDGRHWIQMMGSSLIDNVGFRDAFLLIGQLGLEQKHAIEFHRKREPGGYSTPLEKRGCFSLPFGPLKDISGEVPKATETEIVVEKLGNCGYTKDCNGESFTVMVDTGDGDKRKPVICINGDIVMSETTNKAGRGFNVAVLDSDTKQVKSVNVFDTYEQDSSSMEVFLENLKEGDIIVAVVSDDGQRKLKLNARDLYNQLGSSLIQNLNFRDVWYFVGKKGLKGFSPVEQISFADYDGGWPKPLKDSFCLPYSFQGSKTPLVPKSSRNEARRQFCKKYDGYEHLCDGKAIDEILKPAELVDKSLANHEIFQVPIVIIPGVNHNAIVRTMETTLMQPGIDPHKVLVAYDENFPEYAQLSSLFSFQNVSLQASAAYEDLFLKGMEVGWTFFNDAKHMIFIEEELILAPDFLSFMQQCLDVLDKDSSLMSVSAWNYNGYDITSGDYKAVYRVEEFPGLAFMIQRTVYDEYISGKTSKCCHKRVWDHWDIGPDIEGDIIIPDVSRVFHQPYQSAKDEDQHLIELFQKPRLTNLEGDITLNGVDDLTSEKYDHLMINLINNSDEFALELLQTCIQDPALKIPTTAYTKPNLVIFYKQTSSDDFDVLKKICHCFGLFWVPGQLPRNQYRGAIRFHYKKRNVIVIGSESRFYKYRPSSRYLLTMENVQNTLLD